MALNKNALIRYKTIDKCLQNNYRQWTLNDLIEACSDVLYDYEGRQINVSKRSIQLDIQLMRSDKLGYNAPIVVYDRKYYKYEDQGYSITNIPLTINDMNILSESVEMLKQFKDFSLFSELGGIIQRLEDKVHTEKTNKSAVIHLDKNENLKGLKYLDLLYQAIIKELCLTITYQSFKARHPSEITFHPFILKEFNNRWFIVGRKEGIYRIMNLALDRISNIEYDLSITYDRGGFDGDEYYKNSIGVTVLPESQLRDTELKINSLHAPYVLTKPFHHSQELVERLEDRSIIIRLRVDLNFEFERLILGFGDGIEVLKPRQLRRSIKKRLAGATKIYAE